MSDYSASMAKPIPAATIDLGVRMAFVSFTLVFAVLVSALRGDLKHLYAWFIGAGIALVSSLVIELVWDGPRRRRRLRDFERQSEEHRAAWTRLMERNRALTNEVRQSSVYAKHLNDEIN